MKLGAVAFLWMAVGLPVVVESETVQVADCANEWARQIREKVLPVWSRVTQDELARTWPGELRKIAEGSASTWAELRDGCAIYFVFAPTNQERLDLSSVRVTVIGQRDELLRQANLLAGVLGPGLLASEIAELTEHRNVSTEWRVPSDLSLTGNMKVRTLSLTPEREDGRERNRRWILEVMYNEFADQPIR